jgi:hypothetical protein
MKFIPIAELLEEKERLQKEELDQLRKDLRWWNEACEYLRPTPEDDEKQKLEDDSAGPLV